MVLIWKRFQFSDRAGAALTNCFEGYGFLVQSMASIIDRSELRRERSKYSEKIQEEGVLFAKVYGLHVNGEKMQLW